MSEYYPSFTNPSACADHDPDLWFPQEKSGTRNWTRTPNAIRARTICASCPARQECHDYAIKFRNLYGIWAGLDWYERHEIQDEQGLETTEMLHTFNFSMFTTHREVDYDE